MHDRVGRWTHVATTLDSNSRMIRHYVNGRSFSHEKLTELVPLNFEKSLLGHSSSMDKPSKGAPFRGSIDEFVIFEKAHDEEAIRRIYEIGRPYEPSHSLGTVLP